MNDFIQTFVFDEIILKNRTRFHINPLFFTSVGLLFVSDVVSKAADVQVGGQYLTLLSQSVASKEGKQRILQ